MSSVRCGSYILKRSEFSDTAKGFNEKSASTVSDCYSSDDDYKEGILQDYFMNQSTVLLAHESVAFNGDKWDYPNNITCDDKGKKHDNRSTLSDYKDYDREINKLSLSNLNITSPTRPKRSTSPLFPFEKCISEFYRPPSRSKDSYISGTNDVEEKASVTPQHYIEPTICPLFYTKSKVLQEDLLTNEEYNNPIKEEDISQFALDSTKHYQNYDVFPVENISNKSIKQGILDYKKESNSIGELFKIQNSNNVFLDYDGDTAYGGQLETFPRAVTCKQSRINSIIKSTTTQLCTNEHVDKVTQTDSSSVWKEKCVGTSNEMEAPHKFNCVPDMRMGDCKTAVCFESQDEQLQNARDANLIETIRSLQNHIDTISAHIDKWPHYQTLISLDDIKTNTGTKTIDKKEKRIGQLYPERLVNDLYRQIKRMFYQLDSKIKCKSAIKNPVKHHRHFSEVVRNRDPMYGSGDFTPSRDPALLAYPHRVKPVPIKPIYSGSTLNFEEISPVTEPRDPISRVFELNPYDDLVKSFKSPTDRRIKAVGNKMKCTIQIDGPFRIYDSTNTCWNMRNKTAFRCCLNGITKEAVDKCLKCLQDTFPHSCLNEKHVFCKLDTKQFIS